MFPIYDHFARQGVIQPADPHPSWFHYPQGGYTMPGATGGFVPVHYDPAQGTGGTHFAESSHQAAGAHVAREGGTDDDDDDDDDEYDLSN